MMRNLHWRCSLLSWHIKGQIYFLATSANITQEKIGRNWTKQIAVFHSLPAFYIYDNNSLAHRKCSNTFISIISKYMLQVKFMAIFYKNCFHGDNSPLVQIIAGCHQVMMHYLCQSWTSSMVPHGTNELNCIHILNVLCAKELGSCNSAFFVWKSCRTMDYSYRIMGISQKLNFNRIL